MQGGEVWRVPLPPAPGHAQAGDRPALVVQKDTFTAALPTVLVVPFTGNLAAARFATTLQVDLDGTNRLTTPSIALAFPLRAIDQRDWVQRVSMAIIRRAGDSITSIHPKQAEILSCVQGRVPGRLLTPRELLNFRRNMWVDHGVEVVTEPSMVNRALGPSQAAGFGVDPVTGRVRIYLREYPTRYEVLHEWLHAVHYRRHPEAYLNMGPLDREQFVYSRIRGYYWDTLEDAERVNAMENIVLRFPGETTLNWQTWLGMWK
ncbi:MAG: type II toxin-antitoxin system PemK/MazF family toxin [Planctomycetes bacterium]|nr:type II toxin-antitoxin system PemK/MazF family toxin [Planctomycetota bacterium]